MALRRFSIFAMLCIVIGSAIGCSDDDPVVGPEEPGIATVEVIPDSTTLTSIGEDVQLDATAFDASGTVVETGFVWQSSDSNIVDVGPTGFAVATGIGTAEIMASAGGVTDTATVTVDVLGSPTIDWIAAGSGDWQDGANWSGGAVPSGNVIAVIGAPGTYAVTLSGDVTVQGLILGDATGVQTLATDGFTLTMATGSLVGGAELNISGTVQVQEDIVWSGGSVIGTGTIEIESAAEMNVIGNPLELKATMNNSGSISILPGAVLRVSDAAGMLNNNVSALIELQGDAIVSVSTGGTFTNAGTIHKNAGAEEAAILTSSSIFTTTGTLRVDAGSLWVSGGSLSSIIDIASGSTIRLSSATTIPNIISRGEGALHVEGIGSVIFGTLEGQTMAIKHLILDSIGDPAISGLANLTIEQTFTWLRGTVGAFGGFTTLAGSQTSFGPTGPKALSISTWNAAGEIEAESMALTLRDGAGIVIESPGSWTQREGATVKEGAGGSDGIRVLGELRVLGPGALVIETKFDCVGTMDLVDGALTVKGAFRLLETGVMTGGGTDAVNNNVRLILVGAPSAEMLGTIRPELDGEFARMAISGSVSLGSTCRIELDVATTGAIPTESISFLAGGQVLGGSLALNVLAFPDPGEWRAISMLDGTGAFDMITGGDVFTEIVTDDRGVLLKR